MRSRTLERTHKNGGRKHVNKKVLLIALVLVVAISVFAVGCGEGEEAPATTAATTVQTTAPETTAPPTTAPAETIELTFSCHNPPGNAAAESLRAYAEYIEDNTNGRVIIDVQLGGALYGNKEIFDGVRTHGADAGTYVIDTGDGFYYTTIMSLPFVNYESTQQAIDIFWTLHNEFPELAQEFSDLGLAFGTQFMMPPVHIHWHEANLVVDHPDDLKGKTLLTLEAYVAEWFRMLGASTEQPAFPDLFPMIDNRSADGYIQHFNFLGGFDLLDDFQSHTLFGTAGAFQMAIGAIWHKDTWDALPDDIKQIAIDGREAYVNTFLDISGKDAQTFLTAVEEMGHTMTVLTSEQMAPWQEALTPVYQKWVDGAKDPAVAQKMLDRLYELLGR